MTECELNSRYFNWMYKLVYTERYCRRLSYRKLLYFLHNVDFTYLIDMDGNREEDGIDLRYRFGYENSYDSPVIAALLDNRPCSVLEMMIALAIRCEEQIMSDPVIGDRIGQWFWGMIVNLGLHTMSDEKFDQSAANAIIQRFLNRDYDRDGKGGLFTVKHCKYDLRDVEIWYQMCWYLNSII